MKKTFYILVILSVLTLLVGCTDPEEPDANLSLACLLTNDCSDESAGAKSRKKRALSVDDIKLQAEALPWLNAKLGTIYKLISDVKKAVLEGKLKSDIDRNNCAKYIGCFTSLENLDLNRNQLTELPESIGNLTALERLYLGNNQLSSFPYNVNWKGLKVMYLLIGGNPFVNGLTNQEKEKIRGLLPTSTDLYW
jgi:hypothetical protein